MARANSQALCKSFHTAVLQTALADQPQCPRNCILSTRPSRCSRRAFRPATQTRPKACFRRRGGAWKVTDIALLARTGTTDRTAVDSRGEHGDEELAVEPRIARESRSRTYPPIQFHIFRPLIVVDLAGQTGYFRTSIPAFKSIAAFDHRRVQGQYCQLPASPSLAGNISEGWPPSVSRVRK